MSAKGKLIEVVQPYRVREITEEERREFPEPTEGNTHALYDADGFRHSWHASEIDAVNCAGEIAEEAGGYINTPTD